MESRIYGREYQNLVRATDGEVYSGSGIPKAPDGASLIQSPNSQQPTIDADGLSWPSKCIWQGQNTSKLTNPRSTNSSEKALNYGGTAGTVIQDIERYKNNP